MHDDAAPVGPDPVQPMLPLDVPARPPRRRRWRLRRSKRRSRPSAGGGLGWPGPRSRSGSARVAQIGQRLLERGSGRGRSSPPRCPLGAGRDGGGPRPACPQLPTASRRLRRRSLHPRRPALRSLPRRGPATVHPVGHQPAQPSGDRARAGRARSGSRTGSGSSPVGCSTPSSSTSSPSGGAETIRRVPALVAATDGARRPTSSSTGSPSDASTAPGDPTTPRGSLMNWWLTTTCGPDFGTPRPALYREAIEMCAWADSRGCPRVWSPSTTAPRRLPSLAVRLRIRCGGADDGDEVMSRLWSSPFAIRCPRRGRAGSSTCERRSARADLAAGYVPAECEMFGCRLRRARSRLRREGRRLRRGPHR